MVQMGPQSSVKPSSDRRLKNSSVSSPNTKSFRMFLESLLPFHRLWRTLSDETAEARDGSLSCCGGSVL